MGSEMCIRDRLCTGGWKCISNDERCDNVFDCPSDVIGTSADEQKGAGCSKFVFIFPAISNLNFPVIKLNSYNSVQVHHFDEIFSKCFYELFL